MERSRRQVLAAMATVSMIAAIMFVRSPEPISGQERAGWTPCGCFCGFEPPYPPVPPDMYRIFNSQPCTGILAADACAEGLSNLPPAQLASVCDKVKATPRFKSFKDSCPVFEKFCERKLECPSGQVRYSGTISCDCDGNGSDDTSQSFESCGPPSSFPTTFTSKCQDWARSDGAFSYGTIPAIQQAGREWLQKTYCPANACHHGYANCTGPLETELQKCLTRNRLLGTGARCQRAYDDTKKKCETTRAECLSKAGRAPGPSPVPVPTPTPADVSAVLLPSGLSSEPIWPTVAQACPWTR